MSETTVIEPGALARFTKPHAWFDATYAVGETFVVEEFISAEEAEDGEAFYWGSNHGGINNVTAPATHVEQVKTAAFMGARTIPTVEQILPGMSLLDVRSGDFDLHSSDVEGDTAEVYGRTSDGLPFGFQLKVLGVWQCDD